MRISKHIPILIFCLTLIIAAPPRANAQSQTYTDMYGQVVTAYQGGD